MLRKFAVAAIMAMCSTAEAKEHYWGTVWDDDTVRSWSCSANVYYGMKVPHQNNTEGKYESFGEADNARISIQIKKSDEEINKLDFLPFSPYYFYITKQDQGSTFTDAGSVFYSDLQTGRYGQIIRGFTELNEIEDVTVQFSQTSNVTLILTKDDADWRFMLSTTSLRTAKHIRHVQAVVPMPPDFNNAPDSAVSFITGACVEDKTPNNWKPPRPR